MPAQAEVALKSLIEACREQALTRLRDAPQPEQRAMLLIFKYLDVAARNNDVFSYYA